VKSGANRPRLVSSGAGTPDRREPGAVTAVELLDAVRETLSSAEPSLGNVLGALRESLGAEHLYLVCARGEVCGGGIDVTAFPVQKTLTTLPQDIASEAATWDASGPGATAVRRIAMSIGAGPATWSAGFVRSSDRDELLIAMWDDDVAAADEQLMTAAAEIVALSRSAIRSHPASISEFLRRERVEMAERLHDDILQAATGAILELEALQQRLAEFPEQAKAVASVTQVLRNSVEGTRATIASLAAGRPLADPAANVGSGLPAYVAGVVEQWGLSTRVVVEGDLDLAPKDALTLAGAVIRESLANVAKHASAEDVSVRISATATNLVVGVTDRGRGFTTGDRRRAEGAGHMGLEFLQRRVREFGGTLQIETSPGRGTRVVARIPISEEAS
jgi:signal transduction histidine kinase